MGRPRLYGSAAERQRAFRQRLEAETVRVDRRSLDALHARLDRLQEVLGRAADAGDEIARACIAASVDTILEKLTRCFEARCREAIASRSSRLSPPRR
jgi:hypothetical protein